MHMYLVYDMKECELFVMRGNAKQIARVLDVSPKTVLNDAKTGSLIDNRYKVVKDYDEFTDDD